MSGGVGLGSGMNSKLGRAWVLHGCHCMDGRAWGFWCSSVTAQLAFHLR